jgi:hypothetical protein
MVNIALGLIDLVVLLVVHLPSLKVNRGRGRIGTLRQLRPKCTKKFLTSKILLKLKHANFAILTHQKAIKAISPAIL